MQGNVDLKKKVSHLPDMPGVYLLKNAGDEIIYCGKAGSVKKRIASYFNHISNLDPRRALLASQVKDFEYIVTNSEFEALILESNLIKRYKPRFNVLLRDDKQYPHLCLTINEPFPRLKIVRRIKKDKCLYFGPYTPAKAMRQTVRLIHQIFPIRRCTNSLYRLYKNNKRPCLNYQMGLCCGPCAGLITKGEYNNLINEIILFLQGKKDDLIMKLKEAMDQSAREQKYERAAKLRDNIRAIKSCMEKQSVFSSFLDNQDYFAFARDSSRAYVDVFFIRFGKMTGRKTIHFSDVKDIPDSELMGIVLKQFYDEDKTPPPKVLVQVIPNDINLLHRWLSEKRGANVTITMPKRGKKRELMAMAKKNAALNMLTSSLIKEGGYEDILTGVQKELNLPKLPYIIEGFDISNLGISEAVGAMVFWQNARPVKSKYRKFKIKDIRGIDDYGMIGEVIKRRYERLVKEKGEMPDLILIDGGKGHLNAGIEALDMLKVTGISIISLAKREELIYLPNRESPLKLLERSPTLQLLQRIRDEAHRFALAYQKVRRKKRAFDSMLDDIPGVGPKRKEELLKYFQGLNEIRKASVEEILAVKSIDIKTAKNIFKYLHFSPIQSNMKKIIS